mgnify:CR=1 FL=1
MEREENRYLYVVVSDHDAAFQSVHLTRRAALAACRRDMPGHGVEVVDAEYARAYRGMLTKRQGGGE